MDIIAFFRTSYNLDAFTKMQKDSYGLFFSWCAGILKMWLFSMAHFNNERIRALIKAMGLNLKIKIALKSRKEGLKLFWKTDKNMFPRLVILTNTGVLLTIFAIIYSFKIRYIIWCRWQLKRLVNYSPDYSDDAK